MRLSSCASSTRMQAREFAASAEISKGSRPQRQDARPRTPGRGRLVRLETACSKPRQAIGSPAPTSRPVKRVESRRRDPASTGAMARFLPEEFSTRTGVTRERSARRVWFVRSVVPETAVAARSVRRRVTHGICAWCAESRSERTSPAERRAADETEEAPEEAGPEDLEGATRREACGQRAGTLARAFGDPASNGGAVGRTRT